MSVKEKLYQRIMKRPIPKDITYKEVKSFLENMKFKLVSDGPHKMFEFCYEEGRIPLNVPAHDEGSIVKEPYIRNIQRAIKIIEEL